jgi:phospholipid/cholesterol/gamma-HCH transport system substrate-binding protein
MNRRHTGIEIAVGIFVILGGVALAYLSASIAGVGLMRPDAQHIHARFASVGQLKEGAQVKLAGVPVGEVESIRLADYAAETVLAVDKGVDLPQDTMASVRSEGLLGESFVLLRPGAEEANIPDGGRIQTTEPAIDLVDMFVKYAVEKDGSSSNALEDDN